MPSSFPFHRANPDVDLDDRSLAIFADFHHRSTAIQEEKSASDRRKVHSLETAKQIRVSTKVTTNNHFHPTFCKGGITAARLSANSVDITDRAEQLHRHTRDSVLCRF
jgi:hypothetical protein